MSSWTHHLRDNMELELLSYEGEVIDYNLPKSMEFDVTQAEHAVAGDTATGATKEVVTETGLKVRTPLFVKEGDRIRVNTDSGDTLETLLAKLNMPVDEVYSIFFNSKLLAARSGMGWLGKNGMMISRHHGNWLL